MVSCSTTPECLGMRTEFHMQFVTQTYKTFVSTCDSLTHIIINITFVTRKMLIISWLVRINSVELFNEIKKSMVEFDFLNYESTFLECMCEFIAFKSLYSSKKLELTLTTMSMLSSTRFSLVER